eukprot:g20662.t1
MVSSLWVGLLWRAMLVAGQEAPEFELPGPDALHNFDTTLGPHDQFENLKRKGDVWVSLITVSGYNESTPWLNTSNIINSTNLTTVEKWRYVYQTAFKIKVDNYTLLEVDYSYNPSAIGFDAWLMGDDTHFRVEAG